MTFRVPCLVPSLTRGCFILLCLAIIMYNIINIMFSFVFLGFKLPQITKTPWILWVQFLLRPLYVELACSPRAEVFFLPLSRNMHIRTTGDSELCECVWMVSVSCDDRWPILILSVFLPLSRWLLWQTLPTPKKNNNYNIRNEKAPPPWPVW